MQERQRFEGSIIQSDDDPFGMVLIGRNWDVGSGYRYGFNGKEQDVEIYGNDNLLDFGARLFNPLLGRWFAVDLNFKNYPSVSPYVFVLNTPIIAIDPDGEKVYFVIYTNNDSDGNFQKAAETRRREIENSPGFDPANDHVYVLDASNISLLNLKVTRCIQNANQMGYGKTVEADFYGHNGPIDGPIGDSGGEIYEGQYDDPEREPTHQLFIETWGEINFNWDESESSANFYGCNSKDFAKKFLTEQGPDGLMYATGTDDETAFSESKEKYYSVDKNSKQVYMIATGFNSRLDEVFGIHKSSEEMKIYQYLDKAEKVAKMHNTSGVTTNVDKTDLEKATQ